MAREEATTCPLLKSPPLTLAAVGVGGRDHLAEKTLAADGAVQHKQSDITAALKCFVHCGCTH